MVDSKTVISQVQEFQIILHEIHDEGMIMSESIQVAAIIEKLPPAWKDFKNYLKHKRKEMTIEDLIVRLRIEEDNRGKGNSTLSSEKANVVEHGQAFKSKPKSSHKGAKLGPKGGVSKKQKFLGKCFNCGKPGHKGADCRLPKRDKRRETHMVDSFADINLSAVISEVNMMGSNPREWWLDTGATRHVCCDKSMFYTLDETDNGGKLYMGNFSTSDIKGQGKVILKMTSGKEFSLNNVLYVPDIHKNLVSGTLLNSHGFRQVFESDKYVLSKQGMYVGK